MAKTLLWVSVFFVQFNCLAIGQELTLYIVPSPVQISWDSPSELMRTTLVNQFKNSPGPVDYPLGHIYVGLRDEDRGIEILTGMTRDRRNSANSKIFRKGYGMGILFADIEGRMQETEEVRKSLEALNESGEMSYITFSLPEAAFERLIKYYEEYSEAGYCSIYNGLNRPREGLGAGCAMFSISFLEVAGIDYSPWWSDWSEYVKVPERLIGGLGINNRHVSLVKLALSRNWARDGEPYLPFEVFEPWNMHQWVVGFHQHPEEVAKKYPELELVRNSPVPGVHINARDLEAPEAPIFLHRGE